LVPNSLLHIARGGAYELQPLLHLRQIRIRFVGAAHVRLADDLNQRSAGAIEVDIRIAIRIAEPVVDALAGIVFHVHARDADAALAAVRHDVEETVLRKRLVVLRDLIALRKVGVKIILARKPRMLPDGAAES